MQGFGQPSALEGPLCRSLSLLGQCTLSHFLLSPLIELSVKTEGWLFLWALMLSCFLMDRSCAIQHRNWSMPPETLFNIERLYHIFSSLFGVIKHCLNSRFHSFVTQLMFHYCTKSIVASVD